MVAEDEVDSTYHTKGTQTFGKKMEAIEEPSEEGEDYTPNKVGKPCHLPATSAERSTIAKRGDEKEEASRLQQADNSQTMSSMRTTTYSS